MLNQASRYEDIGKWRYKSTHSYSRHKMEVSGQLHAPATLPPEKELQQLFDRRWLGPRARGDRTAVTQPV